MCALPMVLPSFDMWFTAKWKIIDNEIYLTGTHIYMDQEYCDFKRSEEEQKLLLEEVLGRKFEENGIKADWLRGEWVLFDELPKYRLYSQVEDSLVENEIDKIDYLTEYLKKFNKKQNVYTVNFDEGKVTKPARNKKLEKKFRKRGSIWHMASY